MTVDHLGDLLSAHLDGELTAEETATLDAHLAGCAECQAELDATRVVRSRLRAAQPVDPPFGFYERMLSKRRSTRLTSWSSAAAAAAVWVFVLGFGTTLPHTEVAPPVDAVRAEVANTHQVHVTVMHGDVRWSSLKGGRRQPVPDLPGTPWESIDDRGPKALVFEHDGVSVLVVGDVPIAQLEQTARGVDTSRSIVDHLRDAANAVVSAFNWSD